MDGFVLDHIVNILLNTKKTSKKILSNIEYIFGNSFKSDITEDIVQKRMNTILEYQEKLNILRKIPQVEQRSTEWYNIRNNLITASDFAQAVGKGKFGNQNDFYKKKCGYEIDKFDNTLPALQWGVKYEEVANMFYKIKLNVDVYEFGILKHPTLDFIGASPDGISDMGIMLEIKCPFKRKNTESVPEQYYYQVQGQLEVCDLNECDYLECYFKEYNDLDDMKEDHLVKYKGVIYKLNDDTYLYGKMNDLDFIISENKYKQVYYYGLKEYFLKRVVRDKDFFKEIIVEIETVWNIVKSYKNDENLYHSSIKKPRVIKRKIPVCMITFRKEDEI